MSIGNNSAFVQSGALITLAASTTSASSLLPAGGDTIVVTNATTATAWVVIGGGSAPGAAASGVGYPILAGQFRRIGAGSLVTWIAAVLSTGSGAVYVETGTGSL